VKRISTNVVAVVVIMGLCILPSLYAWFNIFSNWDPYGPDATSNLKVAVASDDKGVVIAGNSVNIGASVLEALEANTTIGWVFTDTSDEAVDGVYDGSYYAVLIIPENFTEDVISFLGGEIEHPDIIYYENGKKNAIAPKITQKAKTTVQEQVNSTFVSTLAETLMEVSNSLYGLDGEGDGLTDDVLTRLNDLSGQLQNYVNILSSFVSILNSAQSIVETSQAMMPNIDSMVSTGEASVNSMQSLLVAGNGTADSVADMVSYSFDMVNDTLDNVSAVVTDRLGTVGNYGSDAGASVSGTKEVMPYLKQMFDQTVSGWEQNADAQTQGQIADIRSQLDVISADLTALETNADATSEQVKALGDKIVTEINNCKNAIDGLRDSFVYTVKPQLDATMNSMQNTMITTAGILNGVDADFDGVESALADYHATLEDGSASLADSLAMAQEIAFRCK